MLIFKLQKFGSRIVFSLLTFSLLFASVMVFVDREYAFYSPLSRAWELLAGALLGKNVDDRDGLERIRYKRMITITESANEDFVDFEKRGLITERKCERPFKFPERDVCLMAHSERSPTAVVIGDSHALHAYWGLAKAFDKQGENLILLGRGACVPFANFRPDGDPNHCQPHMDEEMRVS